MTTVDDHYSGKSAHIIKANRLLQAKVGSGDVDSAKVEKSQAILEKNTTDFVPMATAFLDALEQALRDIPQDQVITDKTILQPLIVEVMQIKANAAMFGYTLVGTLSSIMLNFLEDIQSWNNDARQIVDANSKSLRIIINSKTKGDGGEQGQLLMTELRDACARYLKKNATPK